MIGSGTQADPWVPLTAAELKDCWSNRGGYIDLTCDIDMGDIAFGDPKTSPRVTLNINGFKIYIRTLYRSGTAGAYYIFSLNDNKSTITNGIIVVDCNVKESVYINYGDQYSTIKDVILINYNYSPVNVSFSNGTSDRSCIVCINFNSSLTSVGMYSCVYQEKIYSGNFFRIGNASPLDIVTANLPADVFYVENYLGGKNLCIEKKGKSFVSGVTSNNGAAVKMEVTVLGVKSNAKWIGYSDAAGIFTVNLGSYSDPVSVFATDIINKKLRGNNAYSAGEVAIPFPDAGIKFVCIASGTTSELPNPLPTTGTVNLGTAVFEVKNISPSSCAGPMIPANKYSNYGIKSK